jgi:5-methylcytosine-specific restriction endonuclease McrA
VFESTIGVYNIITIKGDTSMDAGHEKLRQAAIKRYMEKPSICLECGEKIILKDGMSPVEAKRKKFCNRSHAASFNNRKYVKRPSESVRCPGCGNKKDSKATLCHGCLRKKRLAQFESKTIKEALSLGNARVKYSYIRKRAIDAMSIWGIEKKCRYCGFDIVVEVCHKKPISKFNENDLIGNVNSRENLEYLCPNHHAMLDKGLLDK